MLSNLKILREISLGGTVLTLVLTLFELVGIKLEASLLFWITVLTGVIVQLIWVRWGLFDTFEIVGLVLMGTFELVLIVAGLIIPQWIYLVALIAVTFTIWILIRIELRNTR